MSDKLESIAEIQHILAERDAWERQNSVYFIPPIAEEHCEELRRLGYDIRVLERLPA